MNYTRGDVILVNYPFTNHRTNKVRPAIVLSSSGKYNDIFVVPLTSRTTELSEGEFVLDSWAKAGLNVPSVIKRGCYLIEQDLVLRKLKKVEKQDMNRINFSLKLWLNIK